MHSACRHTVHHKSHCIAWSVPLEAVLEEEAEATAVATAVCRSCAFAAEVACALSADAHILIVIHGASQQRGGERKEKTTTFGGNSTRSLVVYWDAQRGGEKRKEHGSGKHQDPQLATPSGMQPLRLCLYKPYWSMQGCVIAVCSPCTVLSANCIQTDDTAAKGMMTWAAGRQIHASHLTPKSAYAVCLGLTVAGCGHGIGNGCSCCLGHCYTHCCRIS